MLQNIPAAVLVDALENGGTLGQDADDAVGRIKLVDHFLAAEILLPHAEAVLHAVPLVPADAFKNRCFDRFHDVSPFCGRTQKPCGEEIHSILFL